MRASTPDESVRDVARVLLMAIFVEMPDYTRASALLGEAFKARTPAQTGDAATHSYFALAGQTINAVRTHLDRYRAFGLNVSDSNELPAEANGDLDQLRGLLERVVEQAKAISAEQTGAGEGAKSLDATALLEDAAAVRLRVARQGEDRTRWQAEVSEARQRLFASETRIASISNIPAASPAKAATPSATPAPAAPNKGAKQDSEQKSSGKQRKPEPVRVLNAETAAAPPTDQPAQPGAGAVQPKSAPTPQPSPGTSEPPAKVAEGSPVAVGSLAGKAKQRVSPSYPPIARSARISGVVTVYLTVDEKGQVISVQRADGPVQLQQAASDAAKRWRFNPTVIDGQPVRVTGYISFNFAL
jgi:protein TonB